MNSKIGLFDKIIKCSGSYICSAENTIGKSNQETTQVDVLCKYKLLNIKKLQYFFILFNFLFFYFKFVICFYLLYLIYFFFILFFCLIKFFICLDAPEIVSLSPRETVLVMARNQTKLTCTASGNPEPKYQWLQLQQSQVNIYKNNPKV